MEALLASIHPTDPNYNAGGKVEGQDPIASNEIDRIGPPRVDGATVWRPSLSTLLCDGESHCRLTATADDACTPLPPSLFVRPGTTALLSPHWTLFGGNHDRIPHLCICRRRRRHYNSILSDRTTATLLPSSLVMFAIAAEETSTASRFL